MKHSHSVFRCIRGERFGALFGLLLVGGSSLPFIQLRQMRPCIWGIRIELHRLLLISRSLLHIAERDVDRRASCAMLKLKLRPFVSANISGGAALAASSSAFKASFGW